MLSLSPDSPARRVLREVFGYDDFRPGQEEVIAALIGGTSVLTVMPTGSGKSLCFQVPALVRAGLTLVVSPLVALMEDQRSEEHTSELQSLMRISYAVFCLKKNKNKLQISPQHSHTRTHTELTL